MPPADPSPTNLFFWLLAFAALAVLMIVPIAGEVVSRLKAGPVRFRLPPASLARSRQPITATAPVGFLVMLVLIVFSISYTMSNAFSPWNVCVLLIWCSIYNQPGLRRRDANRWLVLASGLFTIVIAAMSLALGLQVIQLGGDSANTPLRALMLVYSLIFFVLGAGAIQECISGTRVRERGIEMFSWTHPW
jgi:hypothetical protein